MLWRCLVKILHQFLESLETSRSKLPRQNQNIIHVLVCSDESQQIQHKVTNKHLKWCMTMELQRVLVTKFFKKLGSLGIARNTTNRLTMELQDSGWMC